MNVGQLKKYISYLPDSTEVTISDGQGWLYATDGIYQTITKELDSNQEKTVVVIQPMYDFEQEELEE